uniref:C-type lectin domain-containing protein n=1 Tax=Sinocyclocheilus rhinocerous TaxID=307959 RepID=A0A673KJP8_9TELE
CQTRKTTQLLAKVGFLILCSLVVVSVTFSVHCLWVNYLNKLTYILNSLRVSKYSAKYQCSDNPKWITYKHSSYYISSKWKNWNDSRRDCLQRGADLVIINNKEEQVSEILVTNANIVDFWIGVTDSDEEGNWKWNTWKWVDGSTLTTGFWASKEPNGKRGENCAVTYLTEWPELIGWHDVKCNDAFRLICEKSIFPLIQREIS